jgi:hypothetical protein
MPRPVVTAVKGEKNKKSEVTELTELTESDKTTIFNLIFAETSENIEKQ